MKYSIKKEWRVFGLERRVHLFLLAHNMIAHVKNHKEFTRTKIYQRQNLQIIEFTKDIRSIYKNLFFVHISKKQLGKNLKIISMYKTIQSMKYLNINIP
jgi:hypothetical protein